MDRRLGVDGNHVRARTREVLDVAVGTVDHEMHVHRAGGHTPHRVGDKGPYRDVGHEMPVHDVDVDPLRAGLVDRAHLASQLREAAAQNRRRDLDAHGSFLSMRCTPPAPATTATVAMSRNSPRLHHARPAGQPPLQPGRVLDPPGKTAVDDQVPVVGAVGVAVASIPYPGLGSEVPQPPHVARVAERHHLDRHGRDLAETPHQLRVVHDDQHPVRGLGHHLLPEKRAPQPLDELEPRDPPRRPRRRSGRGRRRSSRVATGMPSSRAAFSVRTEVGTPTTPDSSPRAMRAPRCSRK